MSRWLNIGCGMHPTGRLKAIPESVTLVNHDMIKHHSWVDVAHDLRLMPWPWEDEEFEGVIAFDVIEHIPDAIGFLNECHRILKPYGVLLIHTNNVEHPDKAWMDLTHVRAVTIDSFDYFQPGTFWWQNYGQFYTDRFWQIEEKRRDGTELAFRLRKLPGVGNDLD